MLSATNDFSSPSSLPSNRSSTEMHFTEVNECEGPIENGARVGDVVEK